MTDAVVLPYPDRETGRSSGHAGSETSAQRAHHEDAVGITSERQVRVMRMLDESGSRGMTYREVCEATGWHHGQASGALSVLHKEGWISRLSETRGRCKVYVMPGMVGDRPTEEPGRTKQIRLNPTTVEILIERAIINGRRNGMSPRQIAVFAAARIIELEG